MRILIDTNVLISAFVFGGRAGKVMEMLFARDDTLLVSEYVDREFKEKLESKWHDKSAVIYALYRRLPFTFCESAERQSGNLRDKKDIPVLSDALLHNADIILTGDRDFLEADLERPQILSPAMLHDFLTSAAR